MAAAASPAPPPPRRIHLDATGWSMLRDAAEALDLPVGVLPETPGDPAREPEVRRVLAAQDLLDDRGILSPSVHAALVVLTTAPIAIGVERIEVDRATHATWRSAGAPTAGVLVRDQLDPAGGARREVEVQLLAIDDLLDLVTDELVTDGDVAGTDGDEREAVEVAADDPTALPSGLVADGQLVARAAVTVDGPGGTTVAQLLGDGRRWWQVGSAAAGRLRLLPVGEQTLRASLIGALTEQLAAGRVAGEVSDG